MSLCVLESNRRLGGRRGERIHSLAFDVLARILKHNLIELALLHDLLGFSLRLYRYSAVWADNQTTATLTSSNVWIPAEF